MSKKLSENLTHLQRVRILYKTILKLHRGLPEEIRGLGDNYARDEFKRHRKCNANEANLFMAEWTKYALNLSEQLGLRGKSKYKIGNPLDEREINNLKDEQIMQLYELMNAATGKESDQKILNDETKK